MSNEIPGFVENLIALRQAQQVSQAELARAAGLKRSCISHLERGARSPAADTVVRIAQALGVTTDRLLGLEAKSDATDPNMAYLNSLAAELKPRDLKVLISIAEVLAGKR
jgi:transcriptional regulator with XRE-family HTH domain